MRGRGNNHQSVARCRKKPDVFQRMWDACIREVGEDFHVSQRMRCVAFITSFEGETEAEFYQRLLNLEQGLLDYLFDLKDRVHRRGHFRGVDRRSNSYQTDSYTTHRQPTQKQAANTSGRISEEGIKNPTGNTKQATYTPYNLLLILQSSLIIKQDKYT